MTADVRKPNILLVMPDQMRGDCLSLEGHPVVSTPVIDEIGGAGMHFRRGYTTCASCIPARRSLLTGQYPSTNGMVGYEEGVPIRTVTFPEILRDAGYRTVITGRYMHQSPYEHSYGFEERVLGSTYILNDDYAAFLDTEVPALGGIRGIGLSYNGWQAKPWPLPEYLHPTNWTVARAREVIASSDGRPLFLSASFYAPHPPFFPPGFYMESMARRRLPEPSIGGWEVRPDRDAGMGVDAHRTILEGSTLERAQAGYFGLIDHLDDQLYWMITEFVAMSRQRGREWMVIFTSDHGEMLGDHYLFRKCEPYEGASRIPFLIQGSPGLGFSAGARSDVPVCLEDLMPTILETAGLPIPEGVDGMSLVPLLRGSGSIDRDCVHGEHAPCYDEEQAYHALFGSRMKYVWRPADGTEELFDLAEDPRELVNLAGERADETAAWRERLVGQLTGRAEGFVSGGRLVSGRPYHSVLPFAAPVSKKGREHGYDTAR